MIIIIHIFQELNERLAFHLFINVRYLESTGHDANKPSIVDKYIYLTALRQPIRN